MRYASHTIVLALTVALALGGNQTSVSAAVNEGGARALGNTGGGGIRGGLYSDVSIINNLLTAKRAVDAADRSFDDYQRFLGPNPTKAQLDNYWGAVGRYRQALPGIYGGFSNLDQLLGSDGGGPGLITQGVQAAVGVESLMRQLSGGQGSFIGEGGAEIISKLSAAENTLNLINNFGNTGLGGMREGQLALMSVGQLFPGIADKIAPIANALGSFANLGQGFGGMQSAFGGLRTSIPGMKDAIGQSSLMGRVRGGQTVSQQTTIMEPFGQSPADRKVVSDAGITGRKATDAKEAGEGVKSQAGDAAADPELGKAADEGVAPGEDRSSCANRKGPTKGKGKGVPTSEEGPLLDLTGQTNRLTERVCKTLNEILDIDKRMKDKELEGDKAASKTAAQFLQQTRESYDRFRKEGYVGVRGQQEPFVPANQQDFLNERRAEQARIAASEMRKIDIGQDGTVIADMINRQEVDRYDTVARLKKAAGEGIDASTKMDDANEIGKLALLSTAGEIYHAPTRAKRVLSEVGQLQAEAAKDAERQLNQGQGTRGVEECAKENDEGDCLKRITKETGQTVSQATTKLLVDSPVDETITADEETEPEKGASASRTPDNVRTSSASGGARGGMSEFSRVLGIVGAGHQVVCSIIPDASVCGGGNDGNGEGRRSDPPPPPETSVLPEIVFGEIDYETIQGFPLTSIAWAATGATACTAQNDWITFGDVDPTLQDVLVPNQGTLVAELMQGAQGPVTEGSPLPLSGTAQVFHPMFFKASMRAEKGPGNEGVVPNLDDVASVSIFRDEDGVLTQSTTFTLDDGLFEEFDRLRLDFPGLSVTTPARGTTPRTETVLGALAAAAQATVDHEFSFANDENQLFVFHALPEDIEVPSSATYTISCLGPGGSARENIEVQFYGVE